jgi:hypothetical protein
MSISDDPRTDDILGYLQPTKASSAGHNIEKKALMGLVGVSVLIAILMVLNHFRY